MDVLLPEHGQVFTCGHLGHTIKKVRAIPIGEYKYTDIPRFPIQYFPEKSLEISLVCYSEPNSEENYILSVVQCGYDSRIVVLARQLYHTFEFFPDRSRIYAENDRNFTPRIFTCAFPVHVSYVCCKNIFFGFKIHDGFQVCIIQRIYFSILVYGEMQ